MATPLLAVTIHGDIRAAQVERFAAEPEPQELQGATLAIDFEA